MSKIDELTKEGIKKKYLNGSNYADIGRCFEIDPRRIKRCLVSMGVELRPVNHSFNVRYFETIDTEQKAYWLGFIIADGYTIRGTNTVGIELSAADKDHLEKLKKELEATQIVRIYHKDSTFGKQVNARLTFTRKKFKEDLLKLGVVHNKTFEGFLPDVRKDLERHLLRGYFDGDGSISLRKNTTNEKYQHSTRISGNYRVLKKIEELSGFKWVWRQRFPERNKDNHSIGIARREDGFNFLNYLYSDANVYLDRKKELAQTFIDGGL